MCEEWSFLFIASHLCVGDSACMVFKYEVSSQLKLQFGCSSIPWLAYPISFDVHNANHARPASERCISVLRRLKTVMSQNEHGPGAAGLD